MSDTVGSSSEDEVSLLPHEQLETCLKNLFEVPTKNIDSAFQLILGLIKEQSSQIDGLKRAHNEALEDNGKVRSSMQNAVDDLVREKDELSVDFQALEKKHDNLLQSYDETTIAVDGLKHEIETLECNSLGDNGEHHESELDSVDQANVCLNTETERGDQENPLVDTENTKDDEACDGETELALDQGPPGRIGLAKVKVAEVKLNADSTVAARLDRLEQSLSSLMESLSSMRQMNGQSIETKPTGETLEEISSRIDALETFLHGFEKSMEEEKSQSHEEIKEDGTEDSTVENDSASQASGPVETIVREDGIDQHSSLGESGPTPESRQLSRRGSLLFHLDERETKRGLTMDDLEQQISALRENMQDQQLGPPHDIDPAEIQKQVAELSDGLQKQVAELMVSVSNKVSSEDFESKIKDMRSILSNYGAAEATDASPSSHASSSYELTIVKRQILEQVSKLETTKLDKDAFEQQLEQMERDLKALLDQEISKQQLDISANAEKTEDDLIEIKSIIDSQNDTILHLRDETHISSNMDASMKEEDVNARIQQATDALRVSLEDRLDELGSIESEMDGFASKLAEKPSQDQIDSMLRDLEKRLGEDEALQIILANMRIELKQRMTRGEVMTLVKHTFKEAKLGIQNTKDTLMIGRVPYCLGCSQPFPAGVNGIRAPKMNHDSLPPALGLVSNATLYGAGSKRSLRPLQVLRSAPQRTTRPKSAIIGRFAASSAYVRVRNNSR
eukprot:CAMPEP_0201915924 /NCGR_PEP_ID=MMETSP0903-20130614/5704_1 /ASSEMBLY_ACC=CAM_ASM_000552 /TAXON_ID=420261 /ORGANISM="Thalassiosira antarctica, Strain CCMP982" /LENGTH=736 /DNA_ID=CAMNT_0048451645 /DNA_START=46 /DNA_END=2256 /DNA_ORIENTATION=-